MVQHRCHTVTFFRQHEFSLKYSPLITSLYQNHYQNDNQIVHRCYMQTLLPIHDLCTFKKWHLLVRIIVVIIQNIGHSNLLPTLLDQNSSTQTCCHFENLLSTEDYNRNGNQCDNQNGFPFHCICKWTMNIWTFCIALYFTKTSLCDTFWLFLVSLCDIYINCDMVMGHFNVPAL